jgi:hypothetical protein
LRVRNPLSRRGAQHALLPSRRSRSRPSTFTGAAQFAFELLDLLIDLVTPMM